MELLAQYSGDGDTLGIAGPLFGLLVVALTITTILLIRNMTVRIRRLRERYPDGFPDRAADDRSGASAPPPE